MGVWIETSARKKRSISDRVTPFVGVWIETPWTAKAVPSLIVTPFVGVWIETAQRKGYVVPAGHTLRGCVDWNIRYILIVGSQGSHTLRGCVDWNRWKITSSWWCWVTPFVGVWIETASYWFSAAASAVTPFVGVWIETLSSAIFR